MDMLSSRFPFMISRFTVMGNLTLFLQQTAEHMSATQPTAIFHPRYIEHVAYRPCRIARLLDASGRGVGTIDTSKLQ
jgi:hypothetical protein